MGLAFGVWRRAPGRLSDGIGLNEIEHLVATTNNFKCGPEPACCVLHGLLASDGSSGTEQLDEAGGLGAAAGVRPRHRLGP